MRRSVLVYPVLIVMFLFWHVLLQKIDLLFPQKLPLINLPWNYTSNGLVPAVYTTIILLDVLCPIPCRAVWRPRRFLQKSRPSCLDSGGPVAEAWGLCAWGWNKEVRQLVRRTGQGLIGFWWANNCGRATRERGLTSPLKFLKEILRNAFKFSEKS